MGQTTHLLLQGLDLLLHDQQLALQAGHLRHLLLAAHQAHHLGTCRRMLRSRRQQLPLQALNLSLQCGRDLLKFSGVLSAAGCSSGNIPRPLTRMLCSRTQQLPLQALNLSLHCKVILRAKPSIALLALKCMWYSPAFS